MKINKTLILALVIFSSLTIPFLGSIPYLDGNIDFVKTHDFLVGGFSRLFGNWLSIHPPMKEIITFIFFILGGFNPIAYNLVGILFGLLGIVFFYKLCKRLTNKNIATIAVLLFCSSPLFISAGLFSLTDYLLEIFILAAFYFYSKQKLFFYFLFASFALLTKETGLVLVITILITEVLWSARKINFRKLLISLSPLITAAIWFLLLKMNGKTLWLDWNFSETAAKGTIDTILNNLFTFKIFNKYAAQNWLQLFVLNFNWVFWIIAILGIVKGKINLAKSKTSLSIVIFFLIYFLAVLSFQTYTIPRYALPLEPFFYIAVAYGSYKISEKSKLLKLSISIFLVGITSLRLFTSLDPVSSFIWGKTKILGQTIYALNQAPSLSGFDGMTYNLQYNLIVKKRSEIILDKKSNINDCSWIFPDPNNDFKTIKMLNLEKVNCYRQEENQ